MASKSKKRWLAKERAFKKEREALKETLEGRDADLQERYDRLKKKK